MKQSSFLSKAGNAAEAFDVAQSYVIVLLQAKE